MDRARDHRVGRAPGCLREYGHKRHNPQDEQHHIHSGTQSTRSIHTTSDHTYPPRAPPTPPPAPKALFDVSGRNSGETPSFDGPPHYKVTYSFDCSNYFGGSGTFILLPVDA